MDVFEIGVAALGEGAQKVKRRRRLAISHLDAVGIGRTRLGRELDAVDVVATIAHQLDVPDLLCRRGARLGEVAGNPADFNDRHLRSIGQDH